MNGKEITPGKPPLPTEKENPEERQPDPVSAEQAVNPELIPVEERKSA